MDITAIQSSLNKGLCYSEKGLSHLRIGTQKVVCAVAGFCAQATKELALGTPGLLADIIGPQIAGAGYDWAARPLVVGTHSLLWKKTNPQNAVFTAFSLPVGRAIVAIPIVDQAINAVSNITSKVSDCVTDHIPEAIASKQAVQMLKQHTRGQFICYLQALAVYKLASAFFKVDKPEPSIASVISPMNLVWVGFACSLMRLLAYLQSEDLDSVQTETLPSEPTPIKAPMKPTDSPLSTQLPTKPATQQVTKSEKNQAETDALQKMLQVAKTPSTSLPKKSWKQRFTRQSKTAVPT